LDKRKRDIFVHSKEQQAKRTLELREREATQLWTKRAIFISNYFVEAASGRGSPLTYHQDFPGTGKESVSRPLSGKSQAREKKEGKDGDKYIA